MTVPLLPILYATLQLAALMAVGFALRRWAGLSETFFAGLSRLVMAVALPLYFFVRMSRADLQTIREAAFMPLLAIGFIGVGILVSIPLFKVLGFGDSDQRAGVALSSFGNSGYIPLTLAEMLPATIPFVAAEALSQQSIVYIGAYLFAMSPLLWSVGNLVLTGGSGQSRTESMSVRRLFSPPLIGIVAGLLVPILNLQAVFADPRLPPATIVAAADRIGSTAVPLALFTLGSLIAGLVEQEQPAERLWPMAVAVTAVRLVIMPAVFYGLYAAVLKPLAAAPVVVFVAFLETHTPPATNFSVMAGRAGVNREHTAFSLLVSYAAFVLAMPLLTALFVTVVQDLP